jgi:CRISPR-associated protein Cmr5
MSEQKDRDLSAARARFCFDDVASWRGSWRKEAERRVQSLPVQVRSQGLMVTLATLMRENKDHSKHLSDLLARWLLQAAPRRTLQDSDSRQSFAARLLATCAQSSRAEYGAAQQEAILLFDQVKLYASALSDGGGR